MSRDIPSRVDRVPELRGTKRRVALDLPHRGQVATRAERPRPGAGEELHALDGNAAKNFRQKAVSSRALLWLTKATRSPNPIPSSSSFAAWARASAPTRA